MIDLPYSLVVEATEEPDYFGFYSPELEGFSGIGHSLEDGLYQARWGMTEHVALLKEQVEEGAVHGQVLGQAVYYLLAVLGLALVVEDVGLDTVTRYILRL
jgi:hypothetical protein